ncbi:MAG: aryl-sulfate sulfotransferase [Bradymonadia bacterium]
MIINHPLLTAALCTLPLLALNGCSDADTRSKSITQHLSAESPPDTPQWGLDQLPNGHVLISMQVLKTPEALRAAGRDIELIPQEGIWVDELQELDPETSQVVWSWSAWDHIVQERDADAPNYSPSITDHPGKLDLNYGSAHHRDWLGITSVAYNPERDEIAISAGRMGEVWIIDHSLSTEQARGPAGDLLYRWGNPDAYGLGTADDRQLQWPARVQWQGDQLIITRTDAHHTILRPLVDGDRGYVRTLDEPWGPHVDLGKDWLAMSAR